MGVFNVSGTPITAVYNASGSNLREAYDINGAIVFPYDWRTEVTIEEKRNTTTGTTYYLITIPQIRPNGGKQYPFVFAPYGTGPATMSTLQMNRQYGFAMAINAGVFNMPSSGLYTQVGTIIQNSVVIQQGNISDLTTFQQRQYVFTVDENGELGYALRDASASQMVSDGIVSAVHSFYPIVINYEDAYTVTHADYLTTTDDAQRQIIGQYGNGDYCVITCEGRGFKDSVGFTMPQIREMCLSLGLKHAFLLDGGGSTETVIGDDQINTIYETPYGRKVPTYIVFNGTDEFFAPSEVTS